jgi:hypothetical protein
MVTSTKREDEEMLRLGLVVRKQPKPEKGA